MTRYTRKDVERAFERYASFVKLNHLLPDDVTLRLDDRYTGATISLREKSPDSRGAGAHRLGEPHLGGTYREAFETLIDRHRLMFDTLKAAGIDAKWGTVADEDDES